MGNKYSQLSLGDRERIAILKAEGRSIREIGKAIGKHHSTVVRELSRYYEDSYLPLKANKQAELRKKVAGRRARLKNAKIRKYVMKRLKMGWSPEQISGRLSREKPNSSISHEAIYQFVYEASPELIGYLTRRHRTRYKRGTHRKRNYCHIPNRISISERPTEVNERREIGHWETDMVRSGKSKTSLNVLCERVSRYTHITKLKDKTAGFTRHAIHRRLRSYPSFMRRSITYDNGPENTDHQFLDRILGTQAYFCHPYHSWEKGTVENTIGLIRRFMPKMTDFAQVREMDIAMVEKRLNQRPRKCLGYLTPEEVLQKLSGALAG
jgi:IS30 family transposase